MSAKNKNLILYDGMFWYELVDFNKREIEIEYYNEDGTESGSYVDKNRLLDGKRYILFKGEIWPGNPGYKTPPKISVPTDLKYKPGDQFVVISDFSKYKAGDILTLKIYSINDSLSVRNHCRHCFKFENDNCIYTFDYRLHSHEHCVGPALEYVGRSGDRIRDK